MIAVGFVLLAACLLWAVIGSRGKWWLKLLGILVVPTFGFAVWLALETYRGWPAELQPPAESVFVASLVEEPTADSPGRIYVWLVPAPSHAWILAYHPGSAEPRAYTLPYSRSLHEQVRRGTEGQAQGQTMVFSGGPEIPEWAIRRYRLPPAGISKEAP